MSEKFYGFDSDDFDTDFDVLCPRCGAEVLSRPCTNFFCEGGYIDEHEEDPLWFDPGDESECDECNGTGVERRRLTDLHYAPDDIEIKAIAIGFQRLWRKQ